MSEKTNQIARRPMRRGGGPGMGVGMGEKTMDFKGSGKRLLGRLRPFRATLTVVLVLTIAAVVLSVIAPRVLGTAVDEIYAGVVGQRPIDFGEVGRILAIVTGLYLCAALAQLVQGFLLAKVVQRTVQRLRDDGGHRCRTDGCIHHQQQRFESAAEFLIGHRDELVRFLQDGFC